MSAVRLMTLRPENHSIAGIIRKLGDSENMIHNEHCGMQLNVDSGKKGSL